MLVFKVIMEPLFSALVSKCFVTLKKASHILKFGTWGDSCSTSMG